MHFMTTHLLSLIVILLFGILCGVIWGRRSNYKKMHHRITSRMLLSIGGLSLEELLTHKDELVRQFGQSLRGEPSRALLEKLWRDDESTFKLSDREFYIIVWTLVITGFLSSILLIGYYINMGTSLYIEAGYQQVERPSQTKTIWVAPDS